MRTPPLAALQRADGMNRQARDGRELFLREARRLSKRFQLGAECPRRAGFHSPLSYRARMRASYGSCASDVGVGGHLGHAHWLWKQQRV